MKKRPKHIGFSDDLTRHTQHMLMVHAHPPGIIPAACSHLLAHAQVEHAQAAFKVDGPGCNKLAESRPVDENPTEQVPFSGSYSFLMTVAGCHCVFSLTSRMPARTFGPSFVSCSLSSSAANVRHLLMPALGLGTVCDSKHPRLLIASDLGDVWCKGDA